MFPAQAQQYSRNSRIKSKTIIPFVFLHLRARLAALTEKCFGADSVVAKLEKDYFRSLVKTVEEATQKQGLKFEYKPLKNNERETGIFVENMNELLVWAGIPAFTEVQLLADERAKCPFNCSLLSNPNPRSE
jgi:hypothetical protein